MLFGTLKFSAYMWLVVVQLHSTVAQTPPQSPCPETFSYEFDQNKNQWYGIVKTPSPEFDTQRVINLNLSLKAQLHNDYFGKLELLDDQQSTLKKIMNHEDILYKVSFPRNDVLPQLTLITLDGRDICRGQKDNSAITEINLDYTLYTKILKDNTQFVVNQPASSQTPFPNLADSVQKYEAYKYESQNTVTPPASLVQNIIYSELAPPIQQQSPHTTNNQQSQVDQLQEVQQQLQQPTKINQKTSIIKEISYEKLGQQLKNLNKNILEDLEELLVKQKQDPSKANKSIFLKYTTNFYYVT